MRDYRLHFDLSPLKKLDTFALLACQSYNLGNDTGWFGCFRGGTHGLYVRAAAVRDHYFAVHDWLPRSFIQDAEYHLSSIFFNMDSAIECFTFALNALGSSVAPSVFRDITTHKGLKQISPRDIVGSGVDTGKQPLAGYGKYFPQLLKVWADNRDLLGQIAIQHDVSKHRETIFQGGRMRSDPPPGFFEQFGIPADMSIRAQFYPMAEIILVPDPKAPRKGRIPTPVEEQLMLEPLAERFCEFLNASSRAALKDAESTIDLTHKQFQSPSSTV